MYRSVFYSFHYKNDINRVMQVRNRWVTYGSQTASGIIDHAKFMEIQKQGDSAIKHWIDTQLHGTSATIVLIGAETLKRPYVQYEIMMSRKRGNAILGVRINNLKDLNGRTSSACSENTIVGWENGNAMVFSRIANGLYDYVYQDGYNNLDGWVEKAIKDNNRYY